MVNLRAPTLLAVASLLVTGAVGCGSADPAPTSGTTLTAQPITAHADDVPRAPLPPQKGEDRPHSPFDTTSPAIANLDLELRAAVRAAARDATADGVQFWVTSGWRSRHHQQRLLDAAVEQYGSLKEALRYVSTPDRSAHVIGHAVDIGPTEADTWLAQHGSRYGLCQSFANEIWHFELGTGPGGTCPAPIPDSTYR